MGLIDYELEDVSKLCERTIPGSRLVSCVQSLVRVEISRTATKTIVVCIQFPADYPSSILLIELKSKTLSDSLLEKLTSVCEQELKKYLGKPQILPLLKFVRSFIDENPLSCCYDEISSVKEKVLSLKSGAGDELRLKQKSSSLTFKAYQGSYFLKVSIEVPDNYPAKSVVLQNVDTNFPPMLQRYCIGQAREIARKCVEPPLKKKANEPFSPKPSLLPVLSFLGKIVKEVPNEKCQLCKQPCLPSNPEDAETDENSDMHIERMYCSHLFHQHCLITYMKTPPFQGKLILFQ
ncbi:RING-box protein HRT1 [Frankliniella fusca]|uniref:RING-box protein HRT1 n=1 Tax=Frankliniella fusca TaxID=407009 RepID=A0AAE1I4T4_9NEOP|nr:RING-box protein HRT1 [Frankliniella fusca]